MAFRFFVWGNAVCSVVFVRLTMGFVVPTSNCRFERYSLCKYRSFLSCATVYFSQQTAIEEGCLSAQNQRVEHDEVRNDVLESSFRARKDSCKFFGMLPLASDPLLFVSSHPILTKQECKTLMEWCQRAGPTLGTALREEEMMDRNGQLASHGAKILRKVQQRVHHELLGNVIDNNDYVVPRFVFYPAEKNASLDSNTVNTKALLPDGLHVDTNGNQQFRHWTVLVYLTSNPNSGASIFPLATRFTASNTSKANQSNFRKARLAARKMIYDSNQQHTRSVESGKTTNDGLALEEAAVPLWKERENGLYDSMEGLGDKSDIGIRIIPKAGHVTIFSGLNPDGYPNPLSFHGSEALAKGDGEKGLLSFFYEIPVHLFSSRSEFGKCALESERQFLNWHCGGVTANKTSSLGLHHFW